MIFHVFMGFAHTDDEQPLEFDKILVGSALQLRYAIVACYGYPFQAGILSGQLPPQGIIQSRGFKIDLIKRHIITVLHIF